MKSAPKSLRRMLIRLQKYNFELQYRPGPQAIIADTLSRAYPPSTEKVVSFTENITSLEDAANEAEQKMRMVVLEHTIYRINSAVRLDPVYQQRRQHITKG